MKRINSPFHSRGTFGAVFPKLILCVTLFAFVFYFRYWVEQRDEGVHLVMASPALASVSQPVIVAEKEHRSTKLIDINIASLNELIALPGIGPKLAEAIVKYREAHGPFTQADSLLRVKGIGRKKLEKMAPFLRFEPMTK